MKHLFTLFLFVASVFSMNAQSVSLFNVDASGFPTVKAKFYAFDAANKQQRPSKSELTITENGQPRTITSVTCPPDTVKSLSVCVMVDTYGYGLIKLAQAGTQRLINYLKPSKDEIAITMMNKGVQIHQDFTADMAKAAASASTIPPAPGYVDVQKMFYYPYTGGVPFITGRVSDKKVLILVSDLHCPKLNLDEARLYQDAAKHNISVYAVLLGTTDYSGLFKRVAAKTGGKVFELVKTEAQITNIFHEIERFEHNVPCEISWTSEVVCQAGNTNVECSWQGQKSQSSYTSVTGSIASLQVEPNFIRFGKRIPATTHDTTITLTAINADFIVTGITRKFGSADFSIVNTTFPFSISKNSNKSITLRFVLSDSTLKYASFEIETDKCIAYLSSSGGFPGKKMAVSTLKLTKPNGGESFVAGSDTLITWEGVAPSDTMCLEYSTDNGATWKILTNKATGLKYAWKNVPLPTSAKCLVKVKQSETSSTDSNGLLFTLSGHTSFILSVAYSPDGSQIATTSMDLTAKIWSTKTGTLIWTLTGHSSNVNSVAFSPDGSQIATTSKDKTAKIWSATSGVLIWTLTGHSYDVESVAFSPDGNQIATACGDGTVKIWSARSGALIRTVKVHSDWITTIRYSPDGSQIATGSWDFTAKISSAVTDSLIRTLKGHSQRIQCISYSPDGSQIATASSDATVKIWSVTSGAHILTLTGHTNWVSGVAYSPDGSQIATASGDGTAKIWSSTSGALIRTLKGHTYYVEDVAYSPDGSQIATASGDYTAKIWSADTTVLQEDESDAVFSIIAPEPTLQNLSIDMGKVLVGQSKDSTVLGIVCNRGSAPLHVLGIDITSGDATDFTIPRGAGDFFLDSNECRDVMFGFSPTKVGVRNATATIRTTVGDFTDTISITGEGIAPELAILNPFIDFGKTLVGKAKDSTKVVTIKNVGTSDLTITQTDYNAVNTTNFSTLAGGNSFILKRDSAATMDLRFLPIEVGRRSGILQFHYNGVGSPATIQLFGEGIATLGINPSILATSSISFDSVCVGHTDSRKATITNNGTVPLQLLRAEWTTNSGNVFTTSLPPTTLAVDSSVVVNVDFLPTAIGMTSAQVRWIADKDTAVSVVSGIGKICQGINPSILATNNMPFDSVCIGHSESSKATITNNGTVPLQLIRAEWITNTGNVFSTTLPAQPLDVDSSVVVTIDFLPTAIGMTSAQVRWIADKDTAVTSLSGIGKTCSNIPDTARTTIIAQDITAQAGEKVNLSLKLFKPSGMQAIGAPTDWHARIHYNKSILFNEQTSNVCPGTTDSCVLEITGMYNPKSDELISIPCIATLGNTDHSPIVIDTFYWKNSAIATDVATQNGTITITGTCEDGGVRLFIPAQNSTSLSTRPNPAQDKLQIQYGLREPLTINLELLNMTGQVVQTILNNQTQVAGQYILTSDLSVLGNGVYLLRLRTNKEMLTTRVDVVK